MADILHADDNKRLAKNTLAMYLRTFLVLIVSLYVSRVLLNVLGVDDYGIYNVVGSIVVLFSFFNAAMSTASQRFISFALGTGDIAETSRVFSASMVTQIIITLLLFVVVEIFGLWFMNYKLNIPADRMVAANWAFQFSIITFALNVICVPYEASVIAHERMTFFAYASIIDSVLKLGIVFALQSINYDKLIMYAILLVAESLLMFFVYQIYCKHKFDTCNFSIVLDRGLYKQLLSYTGWTLCSSTADVLTQQGFIFMLNIFNGVVVNAAMGIANQVNSAVRTFVNSFQTSFRPQIVKSYAQDDISHLNRLVNSTSKISFSLMIIPTLILIFNMELVLDIWLENVPQYATQFCQLILICTTIDAITGPYNASIMATKMIRNYQIAISISFILDMIVSFMLIKIGIAPYFVLLSRIATRGLLNMGIGLHYMKSLLAFNIGSYVRDVLLPILLLLVILIPVPLFLMIKFTGWSLLGLTSVYVIILGALSIYFILFNKDERALFENLVRAKILRK